MVSKMKPLWLTWKNSSEVAKEVGKEDVKYIVKNGDGTYNPNIVPNCRKTTLGSIISGRLFFKSSDLLNCYAWFHCVM